MADGGHVCRRTGILFGACTTRHCREHSDQDLKNLNSGLGGDAITRNVYRETVGRTDGAFPDRTKSSSTCNNIKKGLKFR